MLCAGCGGGNARTPQFLCLPHAHKGARMGGWVGGCQPPPPPLGGGGHLSVCGYAKILGGWVPELTPPPPRVAKQNPERRPNKIPATLYGSPRHEFAEFRTKFVRTWQIRTNFVQMPRALPTSFTRPKEQIKFAYSGNFGIGKFRRK